MFGPVKNIGAIIILNGPHLELDVLNLVWPSSLGDPAYPVVCADGGANLLYDISHSPSKLQDKNRTTDRLPSHIVGDLDSIRNEVRAYYEHKGANIVEDKSVNSNDFQKSMRVALSERRNHSHPIIVLGGHGGRMDQTLGNLNVLYNEAQADRDIYWISRQNVTSVLSSGIHHIYIDASNEGPICGLIPVGFPARSVTTKGLKWNLHAQALSFGQHGLISTSNETVEQTVVIETTDPLLWTCELHLALREDISA